jgi:hypothetical protein
VEKAGQDRRYDHAQDPRTAQPRLISRPQIIGAVGPYFEAKTKRS